MNGYIIENYNKKSTFSSFLPGISGMEGIPIWCYYVNRGQGVVSFGVDNKDNAIMEFFPAHQAYKNVKTTGFRTFIKNNGKVIEAFDNTNNKHHMEISKNKLQLCDNDTENNLKTEVTYFTMPTERLGALVRKVTITNTGEKGSFEIVDGMPMLIPFGVNGFSMKMMGQTVKAWMQVEDVDKKVPYYRVRVSMEDSATVSKIEQGNFSFACLEDGTKLSPIVDPDAIFDYDTSLNTAVGFENNSLKELLSQNQATQNQLPASFYGTSCDLNTNESITLYQVVGQVADKAKLDSLLNKKIDSKFFDEKEIQADKFTEDMCSVIRTKTADKNFDDYTEYTYMDNALRGGIPVKIGSKVFYVYSRKHGDIERDYNYFSLLPEYYSQGNGNFRDVNQNRRCDNFFNECLDYENIKMFYDFIQLDGYNPLSIEKLSYTLDEKDIPASLKQEFTEMLTNPFTPGQVLIKLEELGLDKDALFAEIMDKAKSRVNASFGEGYWSDHWTYNLDLIESYVDVYPEKEKDLLFDEICNYFLAHVTVNTREKRYAETENGLRQYHAVNEDNKQDSPTKLVATAKGDIAKSTVIEKLILLSATKYATLDSYGMGVEMEGGKPGWYDALNGLPGLFGSSMAETYELCRNLTYTIDSLKKYPCDVKLFAELGEFIDNLNKITTKHYDTLLKEEKVFDFWNDVNNVKEDYRAKTFASIKGDYITKSSSELVEVLSKWLEVVNFGIKKACNLSNGICPTYFSFEADSYEKTTNGFKVKSFKVIPVPLFLEGVVRYLKLADKDISASDIYAKVKNSNMYDTKLKMYKVNAPLADASYEIGRAKAFTPGWLENESIWLHMEYKYLLEVLRCGLYKEFFEDFKNAGVPFLDESIYGRSILENSSFIASSANPNEKIQGKGFVARLSGSTVEFLSIWKIMMFGQNIFTSNESTLTMQFAPAIPKYLVPDSKEITTVFLGTTQVTYKLNKVDNIIPSEYTIAEYTIEFLDGSKEVVNSAEIKGETANKIRDRKAKSIVVTLK